jgi:5-methylcytosine-specific restriction protein B
LTLPSSLRIVAALNSSDRSVAPLDAALRRRFAILRVDPDYDALAARLGVPVPPVPFALPATLTSWTPEQARQLALAVLRGLNRRLAAVLGEDFLLGHAVFWNVSGTTAEQVVESLSLAFDEQVVGTLRLTFADQDEQLAAVLAVAAGGAAAGAGGPVLAAWEPPDPAVAAVAERRLRITSLGPIPLADAARLLAALA